MKIKIEEVIKDGEKIYLVSEQSPFYPDYKGGQLGDRGRIGEANVLSVKDINGKIYHEVDKVLQPGEYEYVIDSDHRNFIKQHHTAQHILSAAFENVAEISTVSFRMGFEYSTIDLNVPFITDEVLKEVEFEANKIIQSCLDVEEKIVEKEEVDKFPLRKGLSEKVSGKVRIIKIDEYDYSACGGYHVKNTGEIGIVKILKTEKVKGNLTRVYFVAGLKALEYFQNYTKILRSISNKLTSSIFELEERVEQLLEKVKEQNSKLESISEFLAKEKIKNLEKIKEDVFYIEVEPLTAKYLPKYFDKLNSLLIIYDGERYTFISSGKYNVREIIEKLKEKFSGKGGGGKDKGTFVPKEKINIEKIIKLMEVLK
ncbi:MAG: alanyl-tRNA synthetase [Thermosipho sp. (in: thermotogales)]|nr:alanyl-tRNA synthetase [Thermosipho sp. (in: thermotogales)]